MNFVLRRQPVAAPIRMPGKLAYRADIDGLRALAVLPVVLYHIGVPGFGGGFVGVDVFFVISGFLMASLISADLAGDEFSLLAFYERRVRRIFPALFAMLTAAAVAAWLFLMPQEFEYFAESLRSAALFISNIQFEKESGYFDISAELKPLLHTWSLAVEEQFYIVFPLLLVGINRFARQHVVPILAGMLVASFAASIWMVYRKPDDAFYLIEFRAWELLLGALLAFDAIPRPTSSAVRARMASIGVALIAVAVFGFSEDILFPGPAALLPCVGAALVIHARAEGGLAGRALRMRPLVFVGLISYSLYLWHWPLIVFSRAIAGRDLSALDSGLILLASFVVASLSWLFVEQPFRRHGLLRRPSMFAAAATAMVAAVGFGVFIIRDDGMPDRLPSDARKVYAATYDGSRYGRPPCFVETDDPERSQSDIRAGRLCLLGRGGHTDTADPANPSFLVWGDSHSSAMAPAIDEAAKHAGITGFFAGQGSCPPLPGVDLGKRLTTRRCGDFNSAVRDLVRSRHIPLIILAAYWPKYVHDAELPNDGFRFDPSVPPPLEDKSAPIVKALDRLMAEMARQGTRVVLVMDVPEMGFHMPEAIARAMMTGASTDVVLPWDYIASRQKLSRSILTRFAAKYGAALVDPLPAFCSEGRCSALRGGLPLFKDSNHITATTARSLSYLYAPIFAGQDRKQAALSPHP